MKDRFYLQFDEMNEYFYMNFYSRKIRNRNEKPGV